MNAQTEYVSPLGRIILASEGGCLAGLWFAGQRRIARGSREAGDDPALEETRRWLDIYFSGHDPGFTPPLLLQGTPFRRRVWDILLTIPYGGTVTYGQIAKRLGDNMSPQAVGGAVGHNSISIIVPCHRVIGSDGGLTGYAAGVDIKRALLALERQGSAPVQ